MRLASISLIASLLIVPVAAKASTFTDGFATATQGLDVTAAGNFTAIGGTNVDVLGPGAASDGYGYLCQGVTVCVDLGGSGGNPYGNLQSNTVFGPGTYDVTFTLSGSQRSDDTTIDVTFGGYTGWSSITTLSAAGATTYTQDITLTSSSTLDFVLTGTNNGNIGTILDSASVSATPEPSSLVLLGSGLLSGAGALYKRRKK